MANKAVKKPAVDVRTRRSLKKTARKKKIKSLRTIPSIRELAARRKKHEDGFNKAAMIGKHETLEEYVEVFNGGEDWEAETTFIAQTKKSVHQPHANTTGAKGNPEQEPSVSSWDDMKEILPEAEKQSKALRNIILNIGVIFILFTALLGGGWSLNKLLNSGLSIRPPFNITHEITGGSDATKPGD